MNDQYKLKLGLRWWENQTEDPRREGRGPHLSDEWRWKAMQASIAAYGPTAEAVKWLAEALSRELENGGKTLKAITEMGKVGPDIWSPKFHMERIYGRGPSYKYVKAPVFVGDGILRRMATQNPEELGEFPSGDQYRVLTKIVEAAREALQAIGERPDITVQEEEEIAEQVAKAMEEPRCDAGSFVIAGLITGAVGVLALVVITILRIC